MPETRKTQTKIVPQNMTCLQRNAILCRIIINNLKYIKTTTDLIGEEIKVSFRKDKTNIWLIENWH